MMILYPEGTKEKPYEIGVGDRIVVSNPYKTENIIVQAEILIDGNWQSTGYSSWYFEGNKYAFVKANHYKGSIVIQSGRTAIIQGLDSSGQPSDIIVGRAPLRVKVFKIG